MEFYSHLYFFIQITHFLIFKIKKSLASEKFGLEIKKLYETPTKVFQLHYEAIY